MDDVRRSRGAQAHRTEALRDLDESYDPRRHLFVVTGWGMLCLVLAARIIVHRGGVEDLEWLVVPLTLILANAAEWRLHHSLLHRRAKWLQFPYERHTLQHHAMFTHEDMQMGDFRELAFVMFPMPTLPALSVALLPLAGLLWWLFSPGVGVLFHATCVLYVTAYEWLHLSYHWGATLRWSFIRKLAAHHTRHHDPRHMQSHNMNVIFPLWDWVRGSLS